MGEPLLAPVLRLLEEGREREALALLQTPQEGLPEAERLALQGGAEVLLVFQKDPLPVQQVQEGPRRLGPPHPVKGDQGVEGLGHRQPECVLGQSIGRGDVEYAGSFRLRKREPRKGRNPKTGDKVDVPPKKVPYFKPGKELKELINRETAPQAVETVASGAAPSSVAG